MGSSEQTHPLQQHYLQQELMLLERRVANAALIVCLVAWLVAGVMAVALGRSLGLVFTSALVGWFLFLRTALARSPEEAAGISSVEPFVEGAIPTALLLVQVAVRGPAYAMDVPTVPQLYAVIVLLQVIRLRRWLPLAVATSSAVQYALVYAVFIRSALPPLDSAGDPRSPWLVFLRVALVLLTGGLGTLVVWGLRTAVGRAERLVRASELFGKYRLGPRIAQGGMGEVLRAVYCPEGGFERPVALKRINSELSQQPQVVESFRSEAALCSRLLHPNIVQVLDFGRVEDTYFLSMEFVDGGTLGELLWRAQKAAVPVPERVVVQVGRDILAGLSFAYDEARGADGKLLRVLHRDLNPPNVLLSRTGMSKVSDFGIARVGADASDTNSQVVIGKPSYMSPEQASGEPQDGRSDLFAVGIILWELLCGRKLFERGGDSENMLAIVNEDAPPPSRFRALDARWDAFFSRALARALEERFQSAAEMRDALTTLLPGAPPGPADVEAFMARMGEVAPESVASRAGPGPDAKTTLMPPPTR